METRPRPSALLQLLRPHQWVKNLLVAVPLATSHRVAPDDLAAAAWAFVAFSLVASAGYGVNDLVDAAADRSHPEKCLRPVAARAVRPATAGSLAVVAAGLGLGAGALLSPRLAAVLAGYLALSVAYSLGLKRLLLVDVLVLAGLYNLRVYAGAVAVGVEVSSWLLAFGLFLFFSLGFAKRYVELAGAPARGDGPGGAPRAYTPGDLGLFPAGGLASGYLAVLVLALYLDSPAVRLLYARDQVLWLLCPLLFYWVTRLWFLAQRGQLHHDPVVFVLRDPASWLLLAIVAVLLVVATGW